MDIKVFFQNLPETPIVLKPKTEPALEPPFTVPQAVAAIREALCNLPDARSGECQGSRRIFQVALGVVCASVVTGFPGLRETVASGCPLRVWPLQRSGCSALAF